MNRKNFGQLIAALRAERFDPVLGKSWTQQMLAERTGLTARIIGDVERGERVKLDADVLLALAQAFGLTTLERREFFAAVTEIEEHHTSSTTLAPDEILGELLETFQLLKLPAFIHDSFFDIVALNSLFRRFHSVPQDAKNYLAFFFESYKARKRLSQQAWRSYAMHKILQFRFMTIRYRHTTYYQSLFKALQGISNFREIWAQSLYIEDDYYSQVQMYDYLHPEFGQIDYIVTSTSTLTPYGQLFLSVVIPRNDATWQTVAELTAQQPNYVQRLQAWPNTAFQNHSDGDKDRLIATFTTVHHHSLGKAV